MLSPVLICFNLAISNFMTKGFSYLNLDIKSVRKKDRQTRIEIGRQTKMETGRQTKMETGRQTKSETDGQTDKVRD